MIKYIIYTGYVDANDGDRHYISYNTLIRLYGVNPKECIRYDRLTARDCIELRNCKRLYPRRDGDYTLKEDGVDLRKRLEAIKPLEGTTKEVIQMIKAKGFTTGSRAFFDVQREDSDLDIVIKPNASLTFDKIIMYHNGIYLHSEDKLEFEYNMFEFKSIYVLVEDVICNLLLMETQEEYDRWKYATDKMKKLCKDEEYKEKIKNKAMRINLFEEYKEEC